MESRSLPPTLVFAIGGLMLLGAVRLGAPALIPVLMIANAAWSWAFFRNQDLFISFIVLVPYHAVVIALLVSLARVDRVASLALLPYAVYLTYADYWGFGVWRLNS